ncbi:sulfurtransferase [Spiribacter vilamensis]|nr:sulfurtransferase [Spiribacter vilamensis]TVO60068.1 sulfurtransferase [Spiribacter vilamensis]
MPETPLVSGDWLAARLDAPGLVIVDARKGDGYAEAHIPGARQLMLTPLLHQSGRVIDPEDFAAEMARLGVGPDTLVVAYDDGNNLFGARLWWVLRYYGHDNAVVLDGGWDNWISTGLPRTDEAPPAPEPGAFKAYPNPEYLAETADVRAAIDDPDRQIVDVRGDAEWLRATPTEASMAGHIPGALHMVWTDCLDPATRRFRSADELRAHFTLLGLRPEAEIITYCQGGIRAAHTVLALTIAGFVHVQNYEGSWAEWSRVQMPATVERASPVHPAGQNPGGVDQSV